MRDFGLFVGNRLAGCWNELRTCQERFSVISAVVDWLNLQAYGHMERGIERIRSGAGKPFHFVNTLEDILHAGESELFSDALGTLHWQFQKIGDALPVSDPMPLWEIGEETINRLIAQVGLLQTLTFAFNRILFLGGEVAFSDNEVRLKTNASASGREYLHQSALTTALDKDEFFGTYMKSHQEGKSLWRPSYLLVRRIQVGVDGVDVEFAPLDEHTDRSRFAPLRYRAGSEYLFETLFRASAEGIERPSERPLGVESCALHAAYAWDVIHSIVLTIYERKEDFDFGLLIGTWPHDFLVQVISNSLGISNEDAAAALQLLILGGKAKDGTWSKPLLEVAPGEYKLNMAAISSIMPQRFLHLLIANAGLEGLRGGAFERKVVFLIDRFTGTETITNFNVLSKDHPLYGIPKMPETDALLVEGNQIVICETKTFSHISEPREYFLSQGAIDPAERQIARRIEFLKRNKEAVRHALGLSQDPIFHGLVITNGRFLEGSERYDYPVVDSRNLVRFLQNVTIESGIQGYAERPELLRRETSVLRKPGMTHLESLLEFAQRNPDFEFHSGHFEIVEQRVEIDGFVLLFDRGQRATSGGLAPRNPDGNG